MDYQKLLALSGELGYQLLISGAEIYRVENSINYLLHAYGVERVEVFAIPNCIFVGMSTPDQTPLSCIRRVSNRGIDIRKLTVINQLCRELCQDTPALEEAWERLLEASEVKVLFSPTQILGAYAVSTGCFCLFFGGTWEDALVSALCGGVVGWSQGNMGKLGVNLFFKSIVGSFIATELAVILVNLGFGHELDLIVIGALMALAPGLVMTYFMRDIMNDDMLSGLSKLADALLTGAGLALGSGLALSLAQVLGGAM